jgi:hypothetical protein
MMLACSLDGEQQAKYSLSIEFEVVIFCLTVSTIPPSGMTTQLAGESRMKEFFM